LIYQIVWQRALFTIFGVNVESITVGVEEAGDAVAGIVWLVGAAYGGGDAAVVSDGVSKTLRACGTGGGDVVFREYVRIGGGVLCGGGRRHPVEAGM
jgi:hypothetical protein